LKSLFNLHAFHQLAPEAMNIYIFHPNANPSLLYVQPFALYSCYFCCTHNCMADCTGSQASYIIWHKILVWGCEIDCSRFVSPIWELISPDDRMRAL